VALAEINGILDIGGRAPAIQLFTKSLAAINKALELDSEMADAHVALGVIAARHQHEWVAAESHLRHALELNPSSAKAHYNLGQNIYAPQGRWEEALAETRLAGELDPLSPMITMGEPWIAVLQGRHDVAVEGFRHLSESSPHDIMALGGLGFALIGKGDYPAALDVLRRLQMVAPTPQNLAITAWVQARSGNPEAARRILAQLEAYSLHSFVSPSALAVVYAGLGDSDNAFRLLDRAVEQQESSQIYLRAHGFFDDLRKDPRYTALLARVGLSDEQVLQYQQRTSKSHS
jgi:tetratricopeptide (TPR) repeat protein